METTTEIHNGGSIMKKFMLICAPVSSRSGYGDHARDLVHSFLDLERYDIKIQDVPWGNTPRNALVDTNVMDKRILDCILVGAQLDRQPDVYVDIRIPNEFQTWGKINIGITAGIETTTVSGKWLEGCNKMDLIIVPSEHSKTGFVSSHYDKIDPQSQQSIGQLKLEKPIEVLFEGIHTDVYKPLHHKDIDTKFFDWLNEEVPEKFAFLMVGLWGPQPYGEDRKDIGRTIKIFYEAFANKKKQPALILKTNSATFSVMDRESCLKRINEIKSKFPSDWKLPNVYLLHGNFDKTEMNYLYNHPKVKSLVSFTHGEGFGRPLLEATLTGLPIIASGWSGQVDFLDRENSLLVGGEIGQVPQSSVWQDIIIPESQWFTVDENQAYRAYNELFNNNDEWSKKAKNILLPKNTSKYSHQSMTNELDKIMESYVDKKLSHNTNIKLPKLKKVENNKVELPKLKKVKEGSL
jgi:glycosyltransferase involved in cell wall biosynthesis